MNARPIIGLLLIVLALPLAATGVSETPQSAESTALAVRIGVPDGIPVAAMAKIMTDNPRILPGYVQDYTIIASADLVAATLLSGDVDLAVVPSNLAAGLYARGEDVTVVGSVIHGVLYLVTSDSGLELEGLIGRQITMLGRGLTPDILARYLFKEYGLDPDVDLDLRYVNAAAELAPLFISGKADVAVMPEPMLTAVLAKRPDTRILADFQEIWRQRFGGDYPQACLVAVGGFEREHGAYLRQYASALARSIDWVNDNPAAAGELAAALSDQLSAPIVAAAIPRSNLHFVPGAEMAQNMDRYLAVLFSFDPGTVGGALPDEGFYFH